MDGLRKGITSNEDPGQTLRKGRKTMRKQTHFRKVVSLALAAAMAVSVCTTALADDDVVVDASAQPAASETVDTQNKPAEEEKKPEVTDANVEQPEEQASEEESTPATQEAPAENAVSMQDAEGEKSKAPEVSAAQKALQDAIDSAADGATVTVTSDIDLTLPLTVENKKITLNLNGKKLYNTEEIWDVVADAWSLISVRDNGNLTITGNGTLATKENDCYAVDLQGTNAVCTIENGTFIGNMHSVYVQEGVAYIHGGTYSVQQKYPDTNKADGFVLNCYDANRKNGTAKIFVTGGSFANFNPLDNWAEGEHTNFCVGDADDYTVTTDENGYITVTRNPDVAQIGDTKYTTIAKAVAAANSGDTITLLTDVEEQVEIQKDVTLDLGGHTLSKSGSYVLDIYNTVTIKNGTVLMNGNRDDAGGAIWVNKAANLTVDSDVTVIAQTSPKESFALNYYNNCTAAVITVKGKIQGQNGISINGEIKDQKQNKLVLDGANINVTGHGIYQAGDATTVTLSDSTITGATGIEVRAGGLEISNSTITATGSFECVANKGGATTTGAAVAIAQHTTKQAIDVKISGGTLTGAYALYEANPQKNSDTDIAKVKITVNGGKFKSTVNGNAIYAENADTTTVVNGLFSDYNPGQYIRAEGKTIVENTDPATKTEYPYTVGDEVKVDVKTEVKSGDTQADVASAIEEDVKSNAQTTAESTTLPTSDKKTSDTLENAGKSAVQKDVQPVVDKAKQAELTELETKNSTSGTTPTIEPVYTVITYLDVQTKAYDVDAAQDGKILTLDITPKYDIVLTNGVKEVDDIYTEAGKDEQGNNVNQNAIVVSKGKELKVEGEVKVEVKVEADVKAKLETASDNIYVLHDHDGTHYLYKAELKGDVLSFMNPNGFSDFSVMMGSAKKVSINFEGNVKEFNINDVVNGTTLPTTSKDGYTFNGWKIGDDGKVYTKITYDLWNALGTDTVTATPDFTENPKTPAASGDSSSTSAPEATAAPSVGGNEVYYTCVACGHHDWTATAEGYKCNYCGHLESVKQLSGYANVKGTYEPKTSTAKAAAKSAVKSASAVPQTSDDMPIVPIAVIAIAALLGLGVTVVLKRKHN